ncbi:DUF5316 domain-containing protein [Sutcliffiella sp. NPDC057660]|uniref:DUF5316 domain-containing protein n=1 Tax=Sutcliffiella sp. NPDC057660 TaxID=3346199 RepID=UPI0036AE75B0
MKYLYIGVGLSAIGALVSWFFLGSGQAYLIPGGLAAFFLGLSMITSGALLSGDRMRANFATETKEDRDTRVTGTFRLLLLGIPNFIMAIILYSIV